MMAQQKTRTNSFVGFFIRPESQLIAWTVLFGIFSFFLFWVTIKWQLLPSSLSKPELSQENTGLFDALGGWALGFAGALVAIRIAGVAKKIQENDSIREHVNLWEKHVDRVSELNSKLIRSITDAKRECAAVIMFRKEQELERNSKKYLLNTFSKSFNYKTNKDSEETSREYMDKLQEKLEEKLEVMLQTIEEAFKDSIYCSVLKSNIHQDTIKNNEFVSSYFKNDNVQEQLIEIVEDDEKFFDIVGFLAGLGTRNFGIGLRELRAKPLFEHFSLDLKRLLLIQSKDEHSSSKIEIADAAWILLGLLLSRSPKSTFKESYNDGFIIISLILGSLPTDKTIESYLNSKIEDVIRDYSSEGKSLMKRETADLAKRLFFIKGKDLEEITGLIREFNQDLSYLYVKTVSTGLSTEQIERVKEKVSELPKKDASK